jgi:hypothetical protein
MNEQTVTCPNCKTQIKLTESLAAPLVEATRKQYEQKLVQKEADIVRREEAVREELSRLEQAKERINQEVAAKVNVERTKIAADEANKARLLVATDLDHKAKKIADLQEVLRDRNTRLGEAKKAEAEWVRKQRELDDARRELDLTIEKRIQSSLGALREKAKEEAEEAAKLRVVEKEQQIASMQRQIEELRRRAEQGSEQLQGEAQEIDLECTIRSKFPHDVVEPVPKGEFGGDLLHHVFNPLGRQCGTILWESKRTKNWSDGWLTKLRDDQRTAKAELALMVSTAIPKGITSFDLVDGIWVTEPKCAIPVAVSLRHALIELQAARQAGECQQDKMELIYRYLTSSRFRHRIEAIVEKISDMQEDLDRERKATIRLWAKREAQIKGVIESTVGMYGDLQGIAGKAFDEIKGLDLPLIETTVVNGGAK